MSNAELPRSVDPFRLAEQESSLEGRVPLVRMSRLADCLWDEQTPGLSQSCQVKLAFGKDDERRRIVSGQIEMAVTMQCQRCMGPMDVTLASGFRLGLVTSDEQAQQLPRELEPFLTDDFRADLWSMVEDELLLVLPPFPLHERDDCPATETLEALEPDDSAPIPDEEKRENPFSVLADLKPKKH
ncbi:MAG: YceD family protein [Marinobacter sp.]|nr:YceD family protein [Marinobacter sp.]